MPSRIVLDEATVRLVDESYASGHYIVVAYVDSRGRAHVSYRGSTHVHSGDQLAIWVRDVESGLINAMTGNPQVTLMYYNPETRTTRIFYGRGSVPDNRAIQDRIYKESAEEERLRDPLQKGWALLIDLDVVQGRSPEGRFELRREE